MWTWISNRKCGKRQEQSQSFAAMAALIELNLLHLNLAEADSRIALGLPERDAQLLERFKASAQILLAEKPRGAIGDDVWDALGLHARRLNRGFSELRSQLTAPVARS